MQGLEKFYREKLDAIINHQTAYFDYESMIQNHDFNQLIEGSMQRIQLEFIESSMNSEFIPPTERARNRVIENYEKEKNTLRSQLISLESQLESS